MALAGFEVASVERDRRYTQADLVAAVVDYLNSDQQSWTAAGYERWQRTIEGMPSLALIRGQGQMTWYEMAQAAILVIESDPSLDPEWIYEVSRRRDWPSMIPVHSEDELISHLRDFVDQFPGARATRVSFDRWARENGRPSSNMIVSRAKSSWSSLVIAAGGTVSFEKRETYDDEHLLISVAIFLAEHPDGSYQSYERWAREKGFPTPSTILVRFGGWSVAKQKASERIV